jgi:glutathione S-transferase
MPTLWMGNKNYSSWSIRPWFWARHAELPVADRVVFMDTPEFRALVARSPNRRVPFLELDDGELIADSLAIGEAFAELWPDAGTWPRDARLRRAARSACAEMHAGFAALRTALTCNARRRYDPEVWRSNAGDLVAAAEVDIAHVHEVWARLLDASGGPFLSGPDPSFVDAYYAPVVSRFRTYAVPSPDDLCPYRDAIEGLPAWSRWMAEAAREEAVLDKYEL